VNALALARSYGVAVRFAELGDWGALELRAEYDPAIPEIRLSRRVARRLRGRALRAFVLLAVGHELYHHRERIGEVAVIVRRSAREAAADAYAHALTQRWT
jgi:hypothetical protein